MSRTRTAAALTGACASAVWAWSVQSLSLLLVAAALLIVTAMLAFARKPAGVTAIGVVAVSTLLSVAAADYVVGVLVPVGETTTLYDPESDYARQGYHEFDTDLGYRPKPGSHTTRKLVAETGAAIYDVVYTIGPDGFRVTPGAAADPNQVNLFGGSFAFGEGLNDDETLAYFLQTALGTAVKNYAIHGYGMHQALAILQRPEPPAGRLNIFLTVPWHALRSACRPTWSANTPRYVLRQGGLQRDGVCPKPKRPAGPFGRLVAESNTYRYFWEVRRNAAAMTSDDIDLYLAIMREAYGLSRARGQKVMIAFIGAEQTYLRESGWSNQQIADALAEHSDVFIDVTLAAKPEELAPELRIHRLDGHPSALANARRATLIAQALAVLPSRDQDAPITRRLPQATPSTSAFP